MACGFVAASAKALAGGALVIEGLETAVKDDVNALEGGDKAGDALRLPTGLDTDAAVTIPGALLEIDNRELGEEMPILAKAAAASDAAVGLDLGAGGFVICEVKLELLGLGVIDGDATLKDPETVCDSGLAREEDIVIEFVGVSSPANGSSGSYAGCVRIGGVCGC